MRRVNGRNLKAGEVEAFAEHVHADNAVELARLEFADHGPHIAKRLVAGNDLEAKPCVSLVER